MIEDLLASKNLSSGTYIREQALCTLSHFPSPKYYILQNTSLMFCSVDIVELALPPRNKEICHISTSASSYAYANYVSVFKDRNPLFFILVQHKVVANCRILLQLPNTA